MEKNKKKSITLHEETWKILTIRKIDGNYKSIDDLIMSMIKEDKSNGN